MSLPDPVRSGIEAAVGAAVTDLSTVGGGCISPTGRVTLADGRTFFLKWGGSPDLDALLDAEAWGLRQLRDAGAVRVPGVVASGDRSPAWLLLEWLEPGSASPGAWERLGAGLADLHRTRGERFGAERDNYIGSLPQDNTPAPGWPGFWRERRLEPQLRMAIDSGLMGGEDRRAFERLFDRLDELLAPAESEGPSLLHGDLWSGNVHLMDDGAAAIIDPSVYHGHREVDLAMADLFGGFDPAFRAAYEEAWPLEPGYAPERQATYQLYYLLVHVNLFGSGYVSRTREALRRAGASR